MPKITYISSTGSPMTVNAAVGMSVMRAAVTNDVPGIDAEGGGACACGTCHVIVDDAWAGKLPAPAGMERAPMGLVTAPGPPARVCCLVTVTDAMDGLVVRTPQRQG